jgi:NADH:ubiquinone oxidoreductase subunit F (NADH-binding)
MTNPKHHRVLDEAPVPSLRDHIGIEGGKGLDAAKRLGPAATIDEIEAAGLRGRGGAGFPTGRKWRTVAQFAAGAHTPTVVVNAAEGEPGSFKDRAIIRRNPYRVLEGAVIAANAIGADRIIVATKATFRQEIQRLREAVEELHAEGWLDGLTIEVFEGPREYLYGEETALLEVLDGRAPFPRVAPPYRHGVDEVGEGGESAAQVEMASDTAETSAPPTLVDNVETMANVAGILANGADWFRELGTAESPGTVVCTMSGATTRDAVGEFAMGTPLSQVIEQLGGGPRRGHQIVAVMSGVANPLIPRSLFDTPLAYETMDAIGSGLGAAGFIAFDDATDLAAVAHGVSRFLAVESCGQCTPCKQDGLAIADALDRLRRSAAEPGDLKLIDERVQTVADGARCYLAQQHQLVIGSILRLFPDQLDAHEDGASAPVEPFPIAPILDLVDEQAVLDEAELTKQPDWTYGDTWSGKAPADVIDQGPEQGSAGRKTM